MSRLDLRLGLGIALIACTAAGQVPAPDFDLSVLNLTPSSFLALFQVQGPPGSHVQVLITFDNPFSTPPEQIIIYPFLSGQTDAQGSFTTPVQVPSYQGPLPDVWFGAIVATPGGPVVPEIIGLSAVLGCLGCGNLLANHASAIIYERLSETLHVRVFGSDGPYSVWEVNGPCPQIGQPWLAGANANFLGATTAAGGNSAWDGAVAPPAPDQQKCIVIRSNGVNGVVIGVRRL